MWPDSKIVLTKWKRRWVSYNSEKIIQNMLISFIPTDSDSRSMPVEAQPERKEDEACNYFTGQVGKSKYLR